MATPKPAVVGPGLIPTARLADTPRGSLPMYLPPAPFNLEDAATCSLLVDTAYDQFTQWVDAAFPPPAFFNWTPKAIGFKYSKPLWWVYDLGLEPFGFVAQANGDAFLVFRGTETVADDVQDARTDQTPYTLVPNFGNVHAGFFSIYSTMSPSVLQAVNALSNVTRFFFAGHSLGSGLSSLGVPDVINNSNLKPSASLPIFHYNLASPRVGDPQFAYMMRTATNVPTFRVANTEDAVPDLPPSVIGSTLFKHIGTPVDFTAQYGSLAYNHAHWTAYNYALNNPNQPEGPIPAASNLVVGPSALRAEHALLVLPR